MIRTPITFPGNAPLTRAEAAQALYQVSRIAPEAPGMAVFRMQK